MRAVLADEHGNLLKRAQVDTLAHEGLHAVVGRIAALIKEVSAGAPGVAAVGIGAPGPIDSKAGVVSEAPNLPGWVDVPLARIIRDRLGLTAYLANDATLAALGEFTYGAGEAVRHLIYITVSTGVGGGIVIDGQLLEGQRGAAGEIGHIVVEPEGPLCGCGGRGHLEALISGTAIASQARAAVSSGERSLVLELAGRHPDAITAWLVTAAAQEGDPLAIGLLAAAGRRLGYAMINLIHIFNPQMVAVGGGVANAGDLLLGPAREIVAGGLMPVFKEDLAIVPASLGGDAGLYGGIALALQELARP